jgi:Glycosyltransferase Family 4
VRVLLTNLLLADRSGSETWTRDFALALAARGHEPILYTMRTGSLADELRGEGLRVVTRVRETGSAPDIVHGHHPQAVAALMHHRMSPGLFVAHNFSHWMEAPPLLPRFYRYVAVDEPNRERLLACGVPPDRTRMILNAVDLTRFSSRDALPRRPRRALLFSNYATEETHLPAVRETCARAGLALDFAGLGCGNSIARPEEILGRYDVVFAKGRCALEALATGCAVILCDAWGAGPLVTATDVDRMRPLNFGRKLLTSPVTVPHLLAELDRYEAGDAAEASRRIRAIAGLDGMVDSFLGLYEEAIAAHTRARHRPWAERRALAAYVLRLPVPGVLSVTPAHAWMRRTEPIASLLAVRRRLIARLGRPGYGRRTRDGV